MTGDKKCRNMNPNSLKNLIPNQKENKTERDTDTHGIYSLKLAQPKTRELAEEINAALKNDGASWIRQSDYMTIQLLALCLRRIHQADAYLDKAGGLTNKKGEIRPVLDILIKLLKEAQSLADKLGLTPQSRVKLGIDISRGSLNLAELMALGGDQDSGAD